jgi:hypothetical protein
MRCRVFKKSSPALETLLSIAKPETAGAPRHGIEARHYRQ